MTGVKETQKAKLQPLRTDLTSGTFVKLSLRKVLQNQTKKRVTEPEASGVGENSFVNLELRLY